MDLVDFMFLSLVFHHIMEFKWHMSQFIIDQLQYSRKLRKLETRGNDSK